MTDQLIFASQNGDSRKVLNLAQKGVDVNFRGEGDITPIFLASSNGHIDCVKILLRFGADPSIKNYEGLTAIDVAATIQIKELLQKKKQL